MTNRQQALVDEERRFHGSCAWRLNNVPLLMLSDHSENCLTGYVTLIAGDPGGKNQFHIGLLQVDICRPVYNPEKVEIGIFGEAVTIGGNNASPIEWVFKTERDPGESASTISLSLREYQERGIVTPTSWVMADIVEGLKRAHIGNIALLDRRRQV